MKNYLFLSQLKLPRNIEHFIFNAFDKKMDDLITYLKESDFLTKQQKILFDDNAKIELSKNIRGQCKIITFENANYPPMLKINKNAPLFLSVKGEERILKTNCVAVIGTREPEITDIKTINTIVDYIKNDFTIISGLAKGSDCIAQTQSFKLGTIALMAHGHRYCYPKEHEFFLQKIIDNGGCAVSEYTFDRPPNKFLFLQRDKLMAEMSIAILPMRARNLKSGTMATARYGLQLGRKIFTINPKDNISTGNNWLLENKLAEEIIDLDELLYHLYIETERYTNLWQDNNEIKDQQYKTLFPISKQLKTNDKNHDVIHKEISNILKKQGIIVCKNNLIKIFEKLIQIDYNFNCNNTKKILFSMIDFSSKN